MTAVTDTLAKPQRRGAIAQSISDSLVVTRRNLIRMLRIPNLVRRVEFHYSCVSAGQRAFTGKGQVA
ncbi:hypothetical protein [Streptomyces sp. NPDC048623]|uniref:hypothetical protein n=1 Tax=Streptomyces sp. NPDC048623 TaxID=3155761 RepID=UPI0034418591